MEKVKNRYIKLICIFVIAFVAAIFVPSNVNAEEEKDDETEYKVTVEVNQKLDGKYECISVYDVPAEDGNVYINIAGFKRDFDDYGFGIELEKAEYEGEDVTDRECIDEKLDKDKTLKIYIESKYLMTYRFFSIDGYYVGSQTDVCMDSDKDSYKIKTYSMEDTGVTEEQAELIKIYGYAMQDTRDDYKKPDPKTDTIYKPGDTVSVDYAKNFNVVYEYAENINIDYDFNGAYVSPKSYPTSKWKSDLDMISTFEKKPFKIKLGMINGVDPFAENDMYVEPLSYDGYKFAGWKEEKTGKVYKHLEDYEITPSTEIILEPPQDSLIINFIAQWEEEEDDDPETGESDYSNEWVDGKWYNADGTQTYEGIMSWKQNTKGWWIEDTKGWYPKSQWQKVNGKWYYFTADGYMDYSEYREGCWLGTDGAWVEQYFGGHWMLDSTGWWYEDASGWYPKNEWLWIDGVNQHFDAVGYWVEN